MSEKRPGEPDAIESIYVALADDGESGEGIVGMSLGGVHVPLFCSSRSALDAMLGQCQGLADDTGSTIRVIRFARAALVGEFRPGGPT